MGSSITVLCLVKENYIFLFEKLIRIQYMKKNFFVLQGIPKKNETKNADLLSWPFLQKVFFLCIAFFVVRESASQLKTFAVPAYMYLKF